MTNSNDFLLRIPFPHQRSQKIQVMTHNQIRAKLLDRFSHHHLKCTPVRLKHLFCKVLISRTLIWHLIRHSCNWKRQFLRQIFHRIKYNSLWEIYTVLLINSRKNCLLISKGIPVLYQLRQINSTSRAVRFLSCNI